MRSTNHDLKNNHFVGHMPASYLDFKIRHGPHQLRIKSPDAIPPVEVFVPRLVVITGALAKCFQHAFQIVRILQSNMLFHDRNPRRCSAGLT